MHQDVFCRENNDVMVVTSQISQSPALLKERLRLVGWDDRLASYSEFVEDALIINALAEPSISVIVISWRLHPDTLRCLELLQKQRQCNFQLVFVNNGASAGEFASLKPYVDVLLRLSENTGAYLARNIGSLYASAPVLLFLEDDGIPADNLIDAHLKAHATYDVIAVRGVCAFKTLNTLNLLQKHYYLGDRPYPRYCDLEGNVSYAARHFHAAGGWDDNITFGHGGIDLSLRLLGIDPDLRKQIYSPEPVIFHDYAADGQKLSAKRDKQSSSWQYLKGKHGSAFNGFLERWNAFARRPDLLIAKKDFCMPSSGKGVERSTEVCADGHALHSIDGQFQRIKDDKTDYRAVLEGIIRRLLRTAVDRDYKRQQKRDARLLAKSALFDAEFYRKNYPEVKEMRISPAAHYVKFGWAELKDPNEFFDTCYYLDNNREILHSPLNPLAHFILYGWKENRNPSASFNLAKYLECNPDVASSGINPLTHYLRHGKIEGRSLPFDKNMCCSGTGHSQCPPYTPLKSRFSRQFTVATLLRDPDESFFCYEWNLLCLRIDSWLQQLESCTPDFLFVEADLLHAGNAWSEQFTVSSISSGNNPMYALLAFCRSRGIPCVLWGKDDPVGLDANLHVAGLFDYVFTSDPSCLPKYRQHCGHDHVFTLLHAAQPVLHNPGHRKDDRCFDVAYADGWFGGESEAHAALLPMLDAVLASNLRLTILDRPPTNGGLKRSLPEQYHSSIRQCTDYSEVLSAYRCNKVFLNLNSTLASSVATSRRVFELLASGCIVMTTPEKSFSAGVAEHVITAARPSHVSSALNNLAADPEAVAVKSHVGYRHVMAEHTYAHRADEVVGTVLPHVRNVKRQPKVTVVIPTNRLHLLHQCKNNYLSQTHKCKELIVCVNLDECNKDEVENVFDGVPDVRFVYIPSKYCNATNMNRALSIADCDYWAKMDDDDKYGPNYLKDGLTPFTFTDAMIVGKRTCYCSIGGTDEIFLRSPGYEHTYTQLVYGATLIARRKILDYVVFDESLTKSVDTQFLRHASEKGFLIYSADRFNFLIVRSRDHSGHTWKINKDLLLRGCVPASTHPNIFL